MEGSQAEVQSEPKTIQKMGDIFPVDIPIEMISHTDIDGKITPLRLRYEKEGGEKFKDGRADFFGTWRCLRSA